MIKNFFITHPIHKKIVKYFDIFFLLRPTLYFSVWVMIAIGMYSAQNHLYTYPIWISDLSYQTLFLFLGITLVCSSTFILNQIEDVKSDKINGKLFLVGKYFEIEKSLFISKILLCLGLIISFFANFFVIFFAILIYYIWGILYSSKPYNWKKKPILGWISNILIGKILFMIGWCFTLYNSNINISYYSPQLLIIILPYLLCFSAVSLLSMLPDVKGDLINGDQTFPIVYGKKTTKSISLFLVLQRLF